MESFRSAKDQKHPGMRFAFFFQPRTRQHLTPDARRHPSAAPSTAVGRSCPRIPAGLHLPYFFIGLETALLSQLQRQLRSQEPPKSRDLFPGPCSTRWQGASATQSAGKGGARRSWDPAEIGWRGAPQRHGRPHGRTKPIPSPARREFQRLGFPAETPLSRAVPDPSRRSRGAPQARAAKRAKERHGGRRARTTGLFS